MQPSFCRAVCHATVIAVASLGPINLVLAAMIETVPVGNPGNAPDTRFNASVGAVASPYRIGKHEVTNSQYVEFLNAVDPTGANARGLYSTDMTTDQQGGVEFNAGAANGAKYSFKSGRGQNPVVFVTFLDAIRFANWLHNGQGNGDTEDGAYALGATTILRSPNAQWFLPSEDEWHKAAYHKNDGVTGNYWVFPTGTDNVPFSDNPPGSDAPDPSNTANFYKTGNFPGTYDTGFAVTGLISFDPNQNHLSDVEGYPQSASPYGTFDQGGNVHEWTESFIPAGGSNFRILRGGSFLSTSPDLEAGSRSTFNIVLDAFEYGFRVATIVPEPSSLGLGLAGVLALFVRRPRR